MAKQSGLGSNFYVAGYDLSGDISSIDTMSAPMAPIDVTGVKRVAHERIGGQRDAAWSVTSFFEFAGTTNAPGVPGSGTPVVSTFAWAVYVTVTGGTGTQVNINGVNQGTFDGTYILPAFGTITLTYTVAPTWTWAPVPTEHNIFSTLPRADVGAMFAVPTIAVGSPVACIVGKQVDYDPTRATDGSLTMKVDIQGNAFGMEWGLMVTPGIRNDAVATNGAALDSGAAGQAFGGQAYLQLFDLVGTNVDVVLQHSPDNATWNTLIDFGSQVAAPFSARGAVSNTTLVNRYTRVITTGTFSFASFAVAFSRNPVAGVVF